MDGAEILLKKIQTCYRSSEYPALNAQFECWRNSKPFAGLSILDATPVFRNTLCKYLALVAGGANLHIGYGNGIPFDPIILDFLKQNSFQTHRNGEVRKSFELILDCGGANCNIPALLGYVELTRSGLVRYAQSKKPTIFIDESRIKEIETSLGTGDGFYRGLARLGQNGKGKNFLLFGYGKVGRGIAQAIRSHGGKLTIVDRTGIKLPKEVDFIDLSDRTAIEKAAQNAWCVVCATGKKNAVGEVMDLALLKDGEMLIANMGVEDEFGIALPPERVLNGKEPLNFILDEPTELKYIDPALALHNRGALALAQGEFKSVSGIVKVDPKWENEILCDIINNGEITEELKMGGFL